jgi:hypothetical protein
MEKQAESTSVLGLTKGNRGWFRKGDPRINRRGRPHGSKSAPADMDMPVERADATDRLMVLYLPDSLLLLRLYRDDEFGSVTNLPSGCAIVNCRLHAEHKVFAIQIRHYSFPLVARGTVLPEFRAEFHSMVFARSTARHA